MDKTTVNATAIIKAIEDLGCRAAFLPVKDLSCIQSDILGLSGKDLTQSAYFENEVLNRFDFSFASKNGRFDSILVIASPRYITDLCFDLGVDRLETAIPSTYTNGIIEGKIRDVLFKFLSKDSLYPVLNSLPLKAIAARSGLAEYGRNNLCYVKGLGSYVMLSAFYTDVSMHGQCLHDYSVLERCLDCRLCVDNCPTGCITEDAFLIEADRCFTYMNEKTDTFDDLMARYRTGTLLGCNECQNICPCNKEFVKMREGPVYFRTDETRGFLNNTSFSDIPASTASKIADLGLEEYYIHIQKNLKSLLKS